jgi:hydrogenase maturation protease
LVDVGIRGVHLAYDLLDGCLLLVLVDAAPLGRPAGTITVLDLDPDRDLVSGPNGAGEDQRGTANVGVDAHAMTPQTVLEMVRALGGRIGHTVLVACEPSDLREGIGLSDAVESAVDPAVATVQRIVTDAASQLVR